MNPLAAMALSIFSHLGMQLPTTAPVEKSNEKTEHDLFRIKRAEAKRERRRNKLSGGTTL